MWVSVVPDDVVFKLNADDAGVAGTMPAGAGPRAPAWSAGSLWAMSGSRARDDHPRRARTRRFVLDARPVAAPLRGGVLWTATAPRAAAAGPGAAGRRDPVPLATDDVVTDYAVAAAPLNAQLALRDLCAPAQLPGRGRRRRHAC